MELDLTPETQLRLKQNVILDRWKIRARDKCIDPELALDEKAGYVIDHIAHSLVRKSPREFPERVWMNLDGHSLEEVINEYEVLKDTILESLNEEGGVLTEDDRNVIIEGILYYMGMAAWEISQLANVQRAATEAELKKNALETANQKKWFETVLDYLPVGVLVVELGSAKLLFANKAADKLSGGQYPTELDKLPVRAFDADGVEVPKENWPRFRCARGEKMSALELTWVYPGGKTTVVIHSDSLPSVAGEPGRGLIVFQEIEERKRIEENTKAKMHDLEEQESIRSNFVSSLTHDLRTPLTVARMYAETLERKIDPELRSKTNKIVENIDHADSMIRDLLDANRINAGQRLPLGLDDVELDSLVRCVIEDMCAINGDRFVFHSPGKTMGYWCSKSLRRILTNLLTNAVKYGDRSQPIDIYLNHHQSGITLDVHNHGKPIKLDDQPTIFKQFHRIDYKKGKGWGIGLSLVKGLVEAHCGKVTVRSSEKDGTTFTIELPWRSDILC